MTNTPIPLPRSGAELEKLILSRGITPPSNQVAVAVYERVSRYDERSPGYSMEIQPDRAAEYARSQGWTIHKIYSDPNFSGKNSYRPGFKNLLRDIRAGKIQVIVIHKLDRLYRNLESLLRFVRLLQTHHVQLVSVTEQIDTHSWWGRLVMYVIGALAEMWVWQTSERTREAIKTRTAKHHLPAGSFRFGYCNGMCRNCTDPNGPGYCPHVGQPDREESERGRVQVPHPIEAHAVRLIVHLYSQGWSDRDIADHLNRNRFTLPDGAVVQFRTKGIVGRYAPGQFNRDSIRQIITNPFYVGVIARYPRPELSMEDSIDD